MRLHHVNLVLPPGGTAAVLPFYVGVVGLRQVQKPPEAGSPSGAWLETGSGQLHLSERADAAEPHRDSHVAFVVDDLATVLQRVATTGAPWTEQPPVFGGRRGFTRDPLGNRVELIDAADQPANR